MKRELLDNGNIWQKSDGRWIGLVRYKDELGVTQRMNLSILLDTFNSNKFMRRSLDSNNTAYA